VCWLCLHLFAVTSAVSIMKCCKLECSRKITDEVKHELSNLFSSMKEKSLQDQFLAKCLERKDVVHSKVISDRPHNNVWVYNEVVEGKPFIVCRKFIIDLFNISIKRLRIIQTKVLENTSFTERRGAHDNRPHKINENVWLLVKEHLDTIPHKNSHYGMNKSKKKYFDNPELTVVKLFDLFTEYYLIKTGEKLKMKYHSYFKFFKKLDFSFRLPRSDVCDFCSKSSAILKHDPNNEIKSQFELHVKKFHCYKTLKKNSIVECQGGEKQNILVIEFDFAQNLPLPKLNCTSNFYKRSLWMYVFNVYLHNDSSGRPTFYYYYEHESKKGANAVCSMLLNFLEEKLVSYPNVKEIVFLSDAAGGQNKNTIMSTFCSWLAVTRKVKITQLFPVRGHSYGQCDRNFGMYGKILKKKENIYSPEEYIKILESCRSSPEPFKVKHAASILRNIATGLEKYFFKKPRTKNGVFTIQKYVKIVYTTFGTVLAYKTYSAVGGPIPFQFLKTSFGDSIVFEKAQKGSLANAKVADLKSLLPFLPVNNMAFFQDIFEFEIRPIQDMSDESNEENNYSDNE
jgi:hypothetical protein